MTSLGKARDEWLRDGDFAGTTCEDYALTLKRCIDQLTQLSAELSVEDVSSEDWYDVLIELWGHRSASTWNRNRAAVQTFLKWLRDAEVCTVDLPKLCRPRKIRIDDTKARDPEVVAPLWAPGVPLRERALWRLLYESSSRADAVLSLDVPVVDFKRRRARAVIKGGRTVWVHFEPSGAQLLREYLAGRTTGPVWLTNRRPRNWRDRPTSDRAPDGRRYRLSYYRAEEILKDFTRDFADGPLTLHILRHSRLTHLSEDGVSTAMLMAISGHTSPQTLLRRYARPTSRRVQELFDRPVVV